MAVAQVCSCSSDSPPSLNTFICCRCGLKKKKLGESQKLDVIMVSMCVEYGQKMKMKTIVCIRSTNMEVVDILDESKQFLWK